MDFAWALSALKAGRKVTRKDWLLAIPPMYLYMVTEKKLDGKHLIKMHPGTGPDFEWTPTAEQMLIVDDWEEYVEPKKAAPVKSTQEDLPVWPEVNADGYARMSKDSDKIIHDGVYRPLKKEPVFGNTKLSFDENGQLHIGNIMTAQDSHGGKTVAEPDFDAETNKAIALVARNIAENLVELLRNPSVQRILQGNANTDHEKED